MSGYSYEIEHYRVSYFDGNEYKIEYFGMADNAVAFARDKEPSCIDISIIQVRRLIYN